MERVSLFVVALLLVAASAHAQEVVNGVALPATIHVTDDTIPGFAPVTLAWDPMAHAWHGPDGAGRVYWLELHDDEKGEHYAVSVEHDGGKENAVASYYLTRPGVLPIKMWKMYSFFPLPGLATYTIGP